MKRTTAEELLRYDVSKMGLEELQKHRVKLIDAWRESRAEHGLQQAIRDGYYVMIKSESAKGCYPANKWLTKNLTSRIDEVDDRLDQMLTEV